METTPSWLRDNPGVRDDVVERFQGDSRLQNDALPDAMVTDPSLLVDMTKELICEAVRRDAPEGVAEELLVAVRRMTAGVRDLSPSMRTILKNLRGLRDRSELEPVLWSALRNADGADRTKLQVMIDVVQKSEIAIKREETLLADRSGLTLDCVTCCDVGCGLCSSFCLSCCAVGCAICIVIQSV
jgi:hypothetical protein